MSHSKKAYNQKYNYVKYRYRFSEKKTSHQFEWLDWVKILHKLLQKHLQKLLQKLLHDQESIYENFHSICDYSQYQWILFRHLTPFHKQWERISFLSTVASGWEVRQVLCEHCYSFQELLANGVTLFDNKSHFVWQCQPSISLSKALDLLCLQGTFQQSTEKNKQNKKFLLIISLLTTG